MSSYPYSQALGSLMHAIPPHILVAFRVRVDEEKASFLGIGSLQLRIRKSAEVRGWVQGHWLIVVVHQKLLLVTP
jgi:hypothetical protein